MDDFTGVAVWVACAFICFAIAKKKEKDTMVAVAMGLMFGFLAVIGYALAKGSKEYQIRKATEKLNRVKTIR